MIILLRVEIFNYGFSLEFSKDNYNPKDKNRESIKKYKSRLHWCKYSNPYYLVVLNYNYTFLVRLLLNR